MRDLQRRNSEMGFMQKARKGKEVVRMKSKEELIQKIETILDGIDKTEMETGQGWWETSEGAEFGRRKLEAVIAAIKE